MTCRVAVIGAGAAGLAAGKAMRDAGLEVVLYEKGDRPGGLWARDNAGGLSPAYESLHTNTSKGRTQFADFPMPRSWPDYPSADLVAQYLADYAERFGVLPHIRFGSEVVSVDRDGPSWAVTTASGDAGRFDAVVVANGHNWDPRWPDPAYPGEFTGTQIHAHDYRTPDIFRDRRVLVVGMGNSAMDIAVDASHVADGPVLLSARRGVHIVPKYLFGRPSDATGGALAALPWRLRQRPPALSALKLRFEFKMMGEWFNLDGKLVYQNKEADDLYAYGVSFNISEGEQHRLAKVINQMTVLRKLNEKIPDTDFVTEKPNVFLHNVHARGES